MDICSKSPNMGCRKHWTTGTSGGQQFFSTVTSTKRNYKSLLFCSTSDRQSSSSLKKWSISPVFPVIIFSNYSYHYIHKSIKLLLGFYVKVFLYLWLNFISIVFLTVSILYIKIVSTSLLLLTWTGRSWDLGIGTQKKETKIMTKRHTYLSNLSWTIYFYMISNWNKLLIKNHKVTILTAGFFKIKTEKS